MITKSYNLKSFNKIPISIYLRPSESAQNLVCWGQITKQVWREMYGERWWFHCFLWWRQTYCLQASTHKHLLNTEFLWIYIELPIGNIVCWQPTHLGWTYHRTWAEIPSLEIYSRKPWFESQLTQIQDHALQISWQQSK